jgi:hypothetical protein
MSTMVTRVDRLEARAKPFGNTVGRLYVVAGGPEGSAEAFVLAQGYICDDTDLVVHLVALQPLGRSEGRPVSSEPQWAGSMPPDGWKAAA